MSAEDDEDVMKLKISPPPLSFADQALYSARLRNCEPLSNLHCNRLGSDFRQSWN